MGKKRSGDIRVRFWVSPKWIREYRRIMLTTVMLWNELVYSTLKMNLQNNLQETDSKHSNDLKPLSHRQG